MSKGNGVAFCEEQRTIARQDAGYDGRPLRRTLTFAAPLFIENLFQQIYATTDTTEIAQPRGRASPCA